MKDYTTDNPLFKKAFGLFQDSRYREAITELKTLQTLINGPYPTLFIVRCHEALNEYEQALKISEELQTEYPDHISVQIQLAYVLTSLGRYEDAIKQAKKAREQFGPEQKVLLCEAHCYKSAPGNNTQYMQKAVNKYRYAIEKDASCVSAHLGLLELYTKIGQTQKEESHYLTIINAPKLRNNKKIRIAYAIFLQRTERYQQAQKLLENLIKDEPNYIDAHVSLAFTLELDQQYEAAEKAYLVMTNKFPRHEKANLNYAVFLQKDPEEKRIPEAEAQFNKVLSFSKNCKEAYLGLSLLYHAKFEFKQAAKYAKEAIRIDPNYAPAYSMVGHCYADRISEDTYHKNNKFSNKSETYFNIASKIDENRQLKKWDVNQTDPLVNFFSKKIDELNKKRNIINHNMEPSTSPAQLEETLLFPSLTIGNKIVDYNLLKVRDECKSAYLKTKIQVSKLDKNNLNDNLTIKYLESWQTIRDRIQDMAAKISANQDPIEASNYQEITKHLNVLESKLRLYFSAASRKFVSGEKKWQSQNTASDENTASSAHQAQPRIFKPSFTVIQESVAAETPQPVIVKTESKKTLCIDLLGEVTALQNKIKEAKPKEFSTLFSKKSKMLKKINTDFQKGNYDTAYDDLTKIIPKIKKMLKMQSNPTVVSKIEESSNQNNEQLSKVENAPTTNITSGTKKSKPKKIKSHGKTTPLQSTPDEQAASKEQTHDTLNFISHYWQQTMNYGSDFLNNWVIQTNQRDSVNDSDSVKLDPWLKLLP